MSNEEQRRNHLWTDYWVIFAGLGGYLLGTVTPTFNGVPQFN